MSIVSILKKDSNTSEQNIEQAPYKTLAIATSLCSKNKEDLKEIKKITGSLVKNSLDFKDIECDPDINAFMKAHMNAKVLDEQKSKKNYMKTLRKYLKSKRRTLKRAPYF